MHARVELEEDVVAGALRFLAAATGRGESLPGLVDIIVAAILHEFRIDRP